MKTGPRKRVGTGASPDSVERAVGARAGSSSATPRTELGRRLWEIRKRIVAAGEPLLGWDEIDREVAERRGDRSLTEK
jgi:hypothetical protein